MTDVIVVSDVRKRAIKKVINKILFYSKRNISRDSIIDTERFLNDYAIENGVSVHITNKRPFNINTILIDRVEVDDQYLYFWWRENFNLEEDSNQYILGLTFVNKSEDKLYIYTEKQWKIDFPDFYRDIKKFRGNIIELKVFSNAGRFYKEVANHPGEWVGQSLIGKYFAPKKPIGKLIYGNKLYIYLPNLKTKREYYKKLIKIV